MMFSRFLRKLFGDFQWIPPTWIQAIFNFVCTRSKSVISITVGLILAISALFYYVNSLPAEVKITAIFEKINITSVEPSAKPSPLIVNFIYDVSKQDKQQVKRQGKPSVAKIDLIGKKVEAGIRLSPDKAGSWEWRDDNSLKFIPETDWPAGTNYQVKFKPSIFAKSIVLSKKLNKSKTHFSTPKFSAKINSFDFYQDPKDSSIRRVIATVLFSHPVDKTSFEQASILSMQTKKVFEIDKSKKHDFSISYHKNLREAYIQSSPIALPEQSNFMRLTLDKGISSILGGVDLAKRVEDKVLIPDLYSYLKIYGGIHIVRNPENEPEQILTLTFTDEISEQELLKKLSLYQLPKMRPTQVGNLKKAVLKRSTALPLSLIPNERDSSKTFSFRLDVDERDQIYFKIDKQLTSVNGFAHALLYHNIVRVPDYPREVSFSGEGNVLTYSGNHQLGITSRGVSSLKYSVGKLLANKVNHLVSQTRGDIKNPNFNYWQFKEEDIVEYESASANLNKIHLKKANYSSFDLSQYLPQNNERFGLFFVKVSAFVKRNRQEYEVANDKRLILITDLGIIVKDNADQSHHVFVQSIASGLPVAGATVELLGKNGIPIVSGTTDAQGHFVLPSTKTYNKEKTPTVYVVKTENDMSFIPFKRAERQINLSKFDIGGVTSTALKKTALNGFVFSDRGIYRPGETINLGMIVKNSDLSNIENIPLILEISGPKNKRLIRHRYQVPKQGFSDFQFPTEASSDTGQYKAALYLMRNNRYRGEQIGATTFKVEEFQPDTLKIVSKLEGSNTVAWSTADNIAASVSLANLFGTPAQDRKVSSKVIISPFVFNFPELENYRFTETEFDSAQNKQQVLKLNKSLEDKRTDNEGKTSYNIDLSKFSKGTYELKFLVEGFEASGGRSVKSANSIIFSPLKRIIGYKANGNLDYINANSARNVHFIAIDNTLKRQAANDLTLKVVNVQHISTLVKQNNGVYKYQIVKKEVPVSETNIELSEKGFDYRIDSSQAGNFALEVYDNNGQRLSRLSYTVAGFANLAGKIDKNAELQLKLDKQDYFPGDSIKMSLTAPYVGSGLISIETDKVEHFKWFTTTQESTVQEIRLPENIEGTAYINVAFVRDANSNEIFTSPLSYAVQPFSIDKSKRKVDIDLSIEKLVRPGKPMDISFKTSKEAKIAIFAVDEGILQVAGYNTPDPLSHYLKKRALDVKTSQILDLILPDFNLIKTLSASGGGSKAQRKALAKNLNPFARKLDKPAVFWSGIYQANGTEQQVSFDVPNTFSGELRVMAVAVADESVGSVSESTIVRGPFVISPNVLTSAAPDDEFDVTVGVANIIKGSGKNANVTLSVSSSEHLEVIGAKNSQLKIDEGSEAKFTFRVKAKHKLGAAELTFTATHEQEVLYRSASLSIRPISHYSTDFTSGYSDDKKVDLSLDRTLYPNLIKQSVSASSSPLVLVEGLSAYLDSYPHGCTEQIVSKVFPMVGLLSHPTYSASLPNVRKHFDYLIKKLRSRQTANGGFSFWPRSNVSSVYPSIYAMHFLIESQGYGYPVPRDMLEKGKRFMHSLLQQHHKQKSEKTLISLRNRANAIYLLTRMGVVTSNYLVDLEESLINANNPAWESDILSSYMASTYQLLQNEDDANRLIKRYQINTSKKYELDDFHSLLALDAQHIYLLAKHFAPEAKKIAHKAFLKFTDKINQGQYNTISSAYAVLALGAYSQLVFEKDKEKGIKFTALNLQGEQTLLATISKPFAKATYPGGTKQLTMNVESPVFYTNVQSGFNRELKPQTVPAIQQGIELYREYLDAQGNAITEFEQGKEVTVTLKMRALDNHIISNVAIIDLLPGGFEIMRDSVPRKTQNWKADYVDIREDRLIYYGSIGTQVTEISYKAKLTTAGIFTIPSATAESMYDRSIKATTQAGKFTVTASQ